MFSLPSRCAFYRSKSLDLEQSRGALFHENGTGAPEARVRSEPGCWNLCDFRAFPTGSLARERRNAAHRLSFTSRQSSVSPLLRP
jgi:hypothetical protein